MPGPRIELPGAWRHLVMVAVAWASAFAALALATDFAQQFGTVSEPLVDADEGPLVAAMRNTGSYIPYVVALATVALISHRAREIGGRVRLFLVLATTAWLPLAIASAHAILHRELGGVGSAGSEVAQVALCLLLLPIACGLGWIAHRLVCMRSVGSAARPAVVVGRACALTAFGVLLWATWRAWRDPQPFNLAATMRDVGPVQIESTFSWLQTDRAGKERDGRRVVVRPVRDERGTTVMRVEGFGTVDWIPKEGLIRSWVGPHPLRQHRTRPMWLVLSSAGAPDLAIAAQGESLGRGFFDGAPLEAFANEIAPPAGSLALAWLGFACAVAALMQAARGANGSPPGPMPAPTAADSVATAQIEEALTVSRSTGDVACLSWCATAVHMLAYTFIPILLYACVAWHWPSFG